MDNFKIICNMNYFLNYNSIHRYQAEKLIAYIQNIDKDYIKQYKIDNILQLFEQILSYIYLNYGISYHFKNEPIINSLNPLNIFISIIDLYIEDDYELIHLNSYNLEYNNKIYPKYNIIYYIPVNLIKYDNNIINKQIYSFINKYKHNHNKINKKINEHNLLIIYILKLFLLLICLIGCIIICYIYLKCYNI